MFKTLLDIFHFIMISRSTQERAKTPPKKKRNIFMDVFVSHISEEAEVAKVIKEWVESTFLGNFNVFVSSDPDSIPAGTKWLDEITKAITSSKIILLLCSANSIHRPWINFEAGCGWAQSIPVIPICYGGLSRNELPPPINALQSLNLDQHLPERLFQAIAKHLEVKIIPRIDFSKMYEELAAHAGPIEKSEAAILPSNTGKLSNTDDLNEEQIEILKFLAKANNYVTLPSIANQTGLNQQRTEFYLEKLEEKEFIHASYNSFEPTTYSLDSKGREFLFGLGAI
ncbi:TIR domain-containing protein [Desulfocicer niacini]